MTPRTWKNLNLKAWDHQKKYWRQRLIFQATFILATSWGYTRKQAWRLTRHRGNKENGGKLYCRWLKLSFCVALTRLGCFCLSYTACLVLVLHLYVFLNSYGICCACGPLLCCLIENLHKTLFRYEELFQNLNTWSLGRDLAFKYRRNCFVSNLLTKSDISVSMFCNCVISVQVVFPFPFWKNKSRPWKPGKTSNQAVDLLNVPGTDQYFYCNSINRH